MFGELAHYKFNYCYEPLISLHIQTQLVQLAVLIRILMRLAVPDTASHVTCKTDTNSRVTCSKNTAFYKLHAAARLPH